MNRQIDELKFLFEERFKNINRFLDDLFERDPETRENFTIVIKAIGEEINKKSIKEMLDMLYNEKELTINPEYSWKQIERMHLLIMMFH